MTDRLRRRLCADEAGISLVEMLVAMVLVAMAVLALASALVTSLQALLSNETRVRANALANETLENLHAADWDDVAPELPDAESADEPQPVIDETTVERDRFEYTVTTRIEWVNDPATAEKGDYLQFTVTVEWPLRNQVRSVTHSAFRAPPAEEPPSELAVRSVQADPDLGRLKQAGESDHGKVEYRVILNEDGPPTYEAVSNVTLTLVTTTPLPAGSTVTMTFLPRDQWPDGSESGPHALSSVDQQTWTISSGGNWRFPNGDTTFHFTIDTGTLTHEVTKVIRYVHEQIDVATDGFSSTPGGPQATPSTVCLTGGRNSTHPVEVTAHFRGLTADDDVAVSGAGLGPDEVATFGTRTRTGGQVVYTIPAGHGYPSGSSTTVTLTGTRWFDSDVSGSGDVTLTLLDPDDEAYEEACA